MRKAKDLRDQSIEELEASCQDSRKELFRLVNESKQTKKGGATHVIRQKKKEIARILTVLREKQLANQNVEAV